MAPDRIKLQPVGPEPQFGKEQRTLLTALFRTRQIETHHLLPVVSTARIGILIHSKC